MTKHSQLVGGSTAGRLINCPGSYQASQALPPSADKSSIYAEEGSFAHAIMEEVLKLRRNDEALMDGIEKHADPRAFPEMPTMHEYAEAMIGQVFEEEGKFPATKFTREHFEDMIEPGIDNLERLEAEYGGNFKVVAIELSAPFPGIPGAFGTCDLLLVSPTHAIVFDWKFGQGVPVRAVYQFDDGTEELNAQLMYYLSCALAAKGRAIGKRKLVIAICQPRTDEPLTHTVVTKKDVQIFREDLENAVITAIERNPPKRQGEHCRWCPAKIACELWTAPIMGLAEALGETVPAPPPGAHLERLPTPYGVYLAKAKAFVDLLAPYTKAVNDQLHAYLEDGGVVPGWRLKDKVHNRKWIDEEVVEAELSKIGFTESEIWQKKLVTFSSADATAKKRKVKIPDALRVAPPSTETTVCPTDDPAPVVDRSLAREEFSTALRRLA